MNLYTFRIFSKFPGDTFVFRWPHLRSLHKVSCSDSAGRARAFLADARGRGVFQFRNYNGASFPLTSVSFAIPVHGFSCIEHGSMFVLCKRNYASNKQGNGESSSKKSLVESKESPYAHLTPAQKVKEAGKDVTYLVVVVAGIAVTGLMFYMIGSELFSSQSPSGIYGDALKKCQNNLEVTAALGEPIKGYGETTRRGRRRHVSHAEFDVNGIPHMRMKFYIEGPYRKATVHVEVQKNEGGKYDYRYLVVETEGYPHRTFILEDNR